MFKVGSIVLVMSLLLSPLALADQQPDHPSAGLLNQCANYIKMTDSEFKKKGSSILDTIDQCLHFNVCGYPQLSSIDHCAMILAQRNF